ncbi:MAG: penicillin-binding protein 2 [Candidatus Eremiobacteraeota bacterium]|nr:penicillin-binding protein 2 [Candidatus Eremiobacteraeota bacterium]
MESQIDRKKFLFLRLFVVAGLLIILARLIYMQVHKGALYDQRAEENMVRSIPIPADRGTILDRKGAILAQNSMHFNVTLLCFELQNPSAVLQKISEKISLSKDEIREILKKVQITPLEPIMVKEAVNYRTFSRLAEIQGDCPGLSMEMKPLRNYPGKLLAGHIIGHIGEISTGELEELEPMGYQIGDTIGKDGLEKQYDRTLRGIKGARRVLVNVEGRMVRTVGEIVPVTGSSLVLTLDRDLQKVSEKALSDAVLAVQRKNGEPSGGAVVVLSATTGEVLSMASFPGYDPNLFARGLTQKEYSLLMEDRSCPLLNRPVHSAYPCASTYKMITGSAALEEGLATAHSGFSCRGSYDVSGSIFNCFVRSGHGSIGFVDAIAHSCDVVFYMLADRMKIEKFLAYSREFGIGSLTGVDLPGENPGLLPSPEWKKRVFHEEWYAGDTINLSIGQGYVGVTPLQIAVVTAAVANGGTIFRPYLVKRIITSGGKLEKEESPSAVRKVPVSQAHLAVIREGMRGAVRYGTATSANSPVVEISGKTGTAENFPTQDNPRGRNHVWFTSFAPYGKPEIVVTVFIEKSGGFGGEWCGPVARKIMEAYFTGKK